MDSVMSRRQVKKNNLMSGDPVTFKSPMDVRSDELLKGPNNDSKVVKGRIKSSQGRVMGTYDQIMRKSMAIIANKTEKEKVKDPKLANSQEHSLEKREILNILPPKLNT